MWPFWVFVPLVVSLWISTIYLRHHWVADCLAGFILATPIFMATPWLRAYAHLHEQVTAPASAVHAADDAQKS